MFSLCWSQDADRCAQLKNAILKRGLAAITSPPCQRLPSAACSSTEKRELHSAICWLVYKAACCRLTQRNEYSSLEAVALKKQGTTRRVHDDCARMPSHYSTRAHFVFHFAGGLAETSADIGSWAD